MSNDSIASDLRKFWCGQHGVHWRYTLFEGNLKIIHEIETTCCIFQVILIRVTRSLNPCWFICKVTLALLFLLISGHAPFQRRAVYNLIALSYHLCHGQQLSLCNWCLLRIYHRSLLVIALRRIGGVVDLLKIFDLFLLRKTIVLLHEIVIEKISRIVFISIQVNQELLLSRLASWIHKDALTVLRVPVHLMKFFLGEIVTKMLFLRPIINWKEGMI